MNNRPSLYSLNQSNQSKPANKHFVIIIIFILAIISSNSFAITSGVYTNNTDYPIPDNSTSPITKSQITVSGLPSNALITKVYYRLRIPHPKVSDLVMALVSPDGKSQVVWNQYGGTTDGGNDDDTANDADIYFNYLHPSDNFDNDGINGTWELRMFDVASGNTGILEYFSLKFDYMVPNPDLIISNFSPNKTTLNLGEQLSFSATVKNNGAGSSASTTLRYYASTNSTINSSDTEFATDFVTSLSSNGTSNESFSFTPAATGSFYFGVCVDTVVNESNTSNNCSSGTLVTVVDAIPDLQVPIFSIPSTAVTVGQSFNVNATVKNFGTGTSTAETLTYYISSGSLVNTLDSSVGTDSVPSLSANQTSSESISKTFVNPINVYMGACVSIDSNESNQSNNCYSSKYLRLKAVTPSVSPSSGAVGDDFTFTANLAASTPTGYSYYLNFDNGAGGWLAQGSPGGHIPINCSGTSCSATFALNEDGAPRQVRLGMFRDSNDTLPGEYSDPRSFTVSTVVDNPATIQVLSAPSLSGNTITANMRTADDNNVIRTSFVILKNATRQDISTSVSVNFPALSPSDYNAGAKSWGYDPANNPQDTPWNIDVSGLSPGNYEIEFFSADGVNQSGQTTQYPFTISASDTAATIQVLTAPSLSGTSLTANLRTADDNNVVRTSFVILKNATRQDISTSVSVNFPALSPSDYNAGAKSWGYDPANNPQDTPWNIDVSGLSPGNYEIEFFSSDGVNQASQTTQYPFTISTSGAPTFNSGVSITNIAGGFNLAWNQASGSGITYQLYRTLSTADPILWFGIYNGPSLNVNDIGLVDGTTYYYYVEACNSSGCTNGTQDFKTYIDSGVAIPNFVGQPTVTATGNSTNPLEFKIDLDGPLPANYAVYINFDNQQGGWLTDINHGGHTLMANTSGNTYTLLTKLNKPGLRYFRMGIFDTLGDNQTNPDPNIPNEINSENDVLDKRSLHNICDVDYCFDATIQAEGIGNPAISRSGSQLFKNVDVASGNFHLSTVDLAVPGIGPSFAFSRAYNSRTQDAQKQWTFGYEAKAEFKANTYERQITIGPMEDGRFLNFFKNIDFDNVSNDDQWFALDQGNFNKIIENGDGSFVLYTQGNRIYNFAAPGGVQAGRMINIKDRLNHTLSFQYNGSNALTGVTDENSRNYIVTRDGSNRISRITDFSGRYVNYTYGASGHISVVRDPRGYNTNYYYIQNNVANTNVSSAMRLERQNNQLSQRQYTLTYDTKGRVTYLLDGENDYTDFVYGQSNNKEATAIARPATGSTNNNVGFYLDDNRTYVERRVDSEGSQNYGSDQEYVKPTNRTRFAEKSLVKKSIQPLGNDTVTSYATDGTGNPLAVTDAANRTTNATWDTVSGQTNLTPMKSLKKPGISTAVQYSSFTDSGKARTTTDSRGNPSLRAYDTNTDLMSSTTDAENNQTSFTYFNNGYLKDVTDAKGNKTSSTYDSLGRIKTTTTPLGLVTTYTYDNNGNVTRMVESGSGKTYTTDYNYDSAGRMTWSEDPKNFRTNYTYDALGRKKTESYTIAGSGTYTRSYTYDDLGRLASTTNERNQTTDTTYTARSKIESVVNPLNETLSYTYDDNGNVESVTDGEGRTTIKTYDNLNRVKRVTDDNNNYEEYTYTTAGFVDTHRNKNGIVTKYTYDNNGNQKSLRYIGHSELGTVYSTYDRNNNLKTVTDAEGNQTTYTYDELNQLVELKDNSNRRWTYTYDANGNQLTETMPDSERTVSTYDAFNRMKTHKEYSKTNSLIRSISYTYDANGNVESKSVGGSTLSYTYDELNRIKTATGHYGQTIGYQYDAVGNITKIIYPGSNKDVDYTYDIADRMKTVTDWLGNTTTYVTRNDAGQIKNVTLGNNTRIVKSYDVAGRLTSLVNKKSSGTIISSHTNMILDKVGNIKQATSTLPLTPQIEMGNTMTYDNTNRILSNGGDSYTHDLNGRITQNTQSGDNIVYNFNTNDLITSISKNGSTTAQYSYDLNNARVSSVIDGSETRYVVDENSGLPNVIAETNASGVVQRYYIYGDEGLLEQIDNANNVKFYHYDPTGNTLALTNGSQTITDSYAYSPYGTVSQDETNTSINPFLYSGKHGVMDDENGLNYMRARYYKPDIKRFMSLDGLLGSMDNPQSLNRYAYVHGNPIMNIDPSGYRCTEWYDVFIGSCFKEYYVKPIKEGLPEVGKLLVEEIPKISEQTNDTLNKALDEEDNIFFKAMLFFAKATLYVSNNYTVDRYTSIIRNCLTRYESPSDYTFEDLKDFKTCVSSIKDLASPTFIIEPTEVIR